MIKRFSILTFLIVLIVISIVILCGCERTEPFISYAYPTTGTVTDSTTRQPIDSAIVYYLDSSYYALTDSLGQYEFVLIEVMSDSLTCAKEGYITKTIDIEIIQNKPRYDSINFQLVPVP